MKRAKESHFTKLWNKQITIERLQADADWRRLHKLSPRQVALLSSLSSTQWYTSPLRTKAATILSLQERGLIGIWLPHLVPFTRYADIPLKLTLLGKQVIDKMKSITKEKEKKLCTTQQQQ